ncbi:BMC domain-containing protein [Okeania sp.]|uniref:carbon dioxide-concentrating mechanism protein CcmK n=1 Tax=Okeania sp. TaxID=3100323 RepID=UPI002B4B87CB|nr:BMC domain-containing protein [Okeania sp.]MEB3340009.1 BMC domain-containing protein [Okeania sp.]
MNIQPRNNYKPNSLESPINFGDAALGLVTTRSFPAIVGTADMMLKSSGVILVGYEKIGSGYCTAVVRGGIADVRIAVESGAETAEKFGQLISKTIIPRPLPNLEVVLPIGSLLLKLSQGRISSKFKNQAVGLIETRGFPAMVGASDAMLKSADVQLTGYETTGSGLCTAIVRGSVSNVAIAVETGMHEAERIGELNAVMVIPRALEDLERTLPIASYFIEEKPEPLRLPIAIKEKEKELERLPDFSQLSVPMKEEIEDKK